VDTIDDTIATADREWRRYGVRRADRQALAADLRIDLESASADGVTPVQLLGPDLRGFARRLADEAGVRTVPPAYPKVVATALTGSILGAVAGYVLFVVVFWSAIRTFDDPDSWRVPVQVAVGVYYGVPALFVVAGAVAAVRIHLKDLPLVRPTARAMCLLLPLAGIVITPITMAYAWTTEYSLLPQVVLLEALMVLVALGGATALARRWAVREPTTAAEVSLV
jgi:hypothetical protein